MVGTVFRSRNATDKEYEATALGWADFFGRTGFRRVLPAERRRLTQARAVARQRPRAATIASRRAKLSGGQYFLRS